jgi:hypothetical protein
VRGRALGPLLCLALAGCGGGAGAPPEQGRPLEERGRPDPASTGFWEGMVEDGVRELAATVSARGSGQRPLVRIGELKNLTRFHLDLQGIRDRLESSLAASGRFRLVDGGSWDAADQAPDLAPRGEAAELRLLGQLFADKTRQDGLESYTDCRLTLRLLDARSGEVVAMSRRTERVVQED